MVLAPPFGNPEQLLEERLQRLESLVLRHGERHEHKLSPDPMRGSWDAIVRPGESIQNHIQAGARRILLLDGTHTLTADLTLSGVVLSGQGTNTIIDVGARSIVVVLSSRLTNLQVANGTTRGVDGGGAVRLGGAVVDEVIFDNCVQSLILAAAAARLLDCTFQNYAGTEATDSYVHGLTFTSNVYTTVAESFFSGGPAIRWTNGGPIKVLNNIILPASGATVPALRVDSAATALFGNIITNNLVFNGGGTPGADGGGVKLTGGAANRALIANNVFASAISATAGMPYAIHTEVDRTMVIANEIAGGQGWINGIELLADKCQIANNIITGDGGTRSTGSGILVDDTAATRDRNVMMGNIIDSFAGYGISFSQGASVTSTKNVISNNILEGNTTGALNPGAGTLNGVGNQVSNNVTA